MKLNIKKLITLTLLTSSLLFASNIKDTHKQAIDLIKKEDIQKAYSLLENSYNKGDYNNQTLFLLGTSAKKNGDIGNAIKYFELLLKKDDSAHRVRLDLATLYYKKKDLKKAKKLLLVVKASNPPKKVGDNIEKFLLVISKGVQKNYSISASIGYMYDSNANQATSQDTVLMYNLPFTLNENAKETSDKALKASLGINHIKSFEKFALQSSANISMINYKKLDNLDSTSLSASLGATWKHDKKTTISIPVVGSIIKYGHEDSYYSKTYGIAPQVSYQLKKNLSISASISLSQKDYYNQSAKDSNSWRIAPSMRYLIDNSSWVNVGTYIGEEDSKTATSSNDSIGLSAGYFKAFTKELNTYVSTSYNKASYGGNLVAFSKSREDKTTSINGTVSYYVDKIKSNVSLNISHISNDSNIDIYEYDRSTVGVSLAYRF